jgi:hypothetical protein
MVWKLLGKNVPSKGYDDNTFTPKVYLWQIWIIKVLQRLLNHPYPSLNDKLHNFFQMQIVFLFFHWVVIAPFLKNTLMKFLSKKSLNR